MTTQQMIGLAAVVALVAWNYLPNFKAMIPTNLTPKADPLLTHIKNVCDIREQYKTAEVGKACNTLLETLLKVKP